MNRKQITTFVLVLLLALLALPAAPARGGPKLKAPKIKAQKVKKHGAPCRLRALERFLDRLRRKLRTPGNGYDGGIAPATFPVVDGDFLMMAAWTRWQIRANQAHEQATGEGIRVAVLDGGFDLDHPWIAPFVDFAGFDAIDMDFDPHDPGNGLDDDFDGFVDRGAGHGTFVSSMVLTAAPGARIVPIRVRDDEGWGTNQELVRGLHHAWNLGVDVINLSVSEASYGTVEVLDLIDAICDSGTPVIVSVGNEGVAGLNEIASRDTSLGVAAVDPHDHLAWFSNLPPGGSGPVVSAPGVNLYGPLTYMGWDVSGYWSGTSFATGLVSGAVALLRQMQPEREARLLYQDVVQACDPAWHPWAGRLPFGRINLKRLVN